MLAHVPRLSALHPAITPALLGVLLSIVVLAGPAVPSAQGQAMSLDTGTSHPLTAMLDPLTGGSCDGSGDGTWNGCRGTGCSPCLEKLVGYDCYFQNHPDCILNTTCEGLFFDCDAACPAPTAADLCPGGDLDLDGLADSFEAQLLERFAPVVRIHPSDEFWPSSAEWYLSRVHMRFDQTGCSDDQILNKGQVNHMNIDDQVNRNKSFSWFCSRNGSWEYSDTRTFQSSFFLQIPNDSQEFTTRLGSIPADWTCYGHVRFSPVSSEIDIQYWFFYPYNGNTTAGLGAHEGDWEHVTVRVDNSGTSMAEVYYSAHNSEGDWYSPVNLFKTSDGRPIVYSAWHSHASYPWPGQWIRGGGFLPSDYTADGGPVWDCSNSVVNVGEYGRPLNGKSWIRYSGRWGEIGEAFSGPYTPAYQGFWNQD